MADNLPLGRIGPDNSHTLSSESQPLGTTLTDGDRPHPGALTGIAPALLDGGYSVFKYITSPASERTSESIGLKSRSTNDQQATNMGQQLDTTTESLDRSHDTSSVSEISYADPEAGESAATTEEGPGKAPLDRPRRSWMWVGAIIFVMLFFISVPGIVVGIKTSEISSGMTTSEAVSPFVIFAGGLFYRHNR